MTVTAPPRPPQTPPPSRRRDPVEHVDPEALIEEARQRARRRRRAYAAATAALALLAVSLAVVFGRPEPSQSAADGPAPAPIPPDEDDATIVALHGEFHVGWVVVYADGRVIRSGGGSRFSIFERRLTTAGVELVRSGAVQPSAVLREFVLASGWDVPRSLPAGAWADADVETYEPSMAALCPSTRSGATGTGLMNRLPPAAQALLRGKERRTFNNVFQALDQSVAPPVECFIVTIEETRALRQILSDWGLTPIAGSDERYENCGLAANIVEAKTICGGLESAGDQPLGFYVPVEGVGEPVELMTIGVEPILPHGAWINLPG